MDPLYVAYDNLELPILLVHLQSAGLTEIHHHIQFVWL